MTDKVTPTIIREMKLSEMVKVSRILLRQGWKPTFAGIRMYILTIPNPTGGKRLIVGTVGIAHENKICFLTVEPAHRRKGYGRKLMKRAIEVCNDPHLYVRFTNIKAIMLYLSLGFKITGKLNKTFKMSIPVPVKKAPNMKIAIQEVNLTLKSMRNSYEYFKDGWTIRNIDGKYKFAKMGKDISEVLQIGKVHQGEFSPSIPKNYYRDIYAYREILKEGIKSALQLEEFRYWLDDKGTPWTKRFANYMYKTHKEKIEPDILSSIGNQFRAFIPLKYNMQFVTKPDWQSGQFGDEGSCWFSFRSYMMEDLFGSGHGYAVKFYGSPTPDNNKGIGRAWLYSTGEHFFLFNVRGLRENIMAEVIAKHLNLVYKEVELYIKNPGGNRYTYIDGNRFYVFGKTEFPDTSYTMDWSAT